MLWNWNLKQSNRGAFAFESMFQSRSILNQCFALGWSKYFCNNICQERTFGGARLPRRRWPIAN
jgi:hypothetical protein